MSYTRVLLKLSGEMLGGKSGQGIDKAAIEDMAAEIASVHDEGYEIAVVIGGGNFFRGTVAKSFGMERTAADYMGMLATCMNALALQAVLENAFGKDTRVMTAIHIHSLAEPYIRRKAIKHLSRKRVVIFAGGTGSPLFSTDTAASLRALEVGANVILKGTKVDGIYDRDPMKFPDAKRFERLSYLEVIAGNLNVMDATSITMCMENKLPIRVFKVGEKGNVLNALKNENVGTTVS